MLLVLIPAARDWTLLRIAGTGADVLLTNMAAALTGLANSEAFRLSDQAHTQLADALVCLVLLSITGFVVSGRVQKHVDEIIFWRKVRTLIARKSYTLRAASTRPRDTVSGPLVL